MKVAIVGTLLVATLAGQGVQRQRGVALEHLSGDEAAKVLTPDAVVVLPLGAALEAHGLHLALRNDLRMAEYFAGRVTAAAAVVMAPPLTYHFSPAISEYPGSASLTSETARDLTVQVVRSLARSGARRFYVLNTGLSTNRPLQAAAEVLAREGVLLRYTDFGAHTDRLSARVRQQEADGHADEVETSMMLYVDPAAVNMPRAPGHINATREKGQVIVENLVTAMLQEIDMLRVAALPVPQPQTKAPATRGPRDISLGSVRVSECVPGVERDIKRVEAAFNASWINRDHDRLGGLWTDQGDLIHGDGTIEKGRGTIIQSRREQFKMREYQKARHSIAFGVIRCLTSEIAVVDGRWDLQDVTDAAGKTLPRAEGLMTMVLRGGGENWLIEAYRYNTKPGAPTAPMLLKRPGYPDKE